MKKVFIVGLIFPLLLIFIVKAYADTKIGGNGYQCVDADNRWKTEDEAEGAIQHDIASVIVKAGQSCVEVYPTNSNPTCYEAVVNGGQVTVIKIGDGRDCQDISHLEGTYIAPATPSVTVIPSTSVTPTSILSPTPILSISPTSTPSATPTVVIIPTNTPRITTAPTATTGQGGGGDATIANQKQEEVKSVSIEPCTPTTCGMK